MGKLVSDGSDDRFSYFTFTGRKGMEGEGDMENEWLSPEEIAAKRKANQEYIKELKETGEYGKEYEIKIEMEHDPFFMPSPTSPTESYSMVIMDLSAPAPPKEERPETDSEKHYREFWDKWTKENPGVDPFPGEGS